MATAYLKPVLKACAGDFCRYVELHITNKGRARAPIVENVPPMTGDASPGTPQL